MKLLYLFLVLGTLNACKQQAPANKTTEDTTLTDLNKITEGIVVFEKDDCSRCGQTIAYLKENKIAYKTLNISATEENNYIMWQLLEAAGYTAEEVQTPVVIVKGKVTYNHPDLEVFLKGLH